MTEIQTDAKSTGAKIRNMRKTRCLTLQQIADNIGVSVSAVSQYERGIIKPDAIMLFKIARALECPLTGIASKSVIEKMCKELHEFLNILPQEMRSIYVPTVDAVEVVRCRDCLNCGMNASIKYDGYRDDVRLCMLHGIAILPDDYCSGGVKADVEVGSDD